LEIREYHTKMCLVLRFFDCQLALEQPVGDESDINLRAGWPGAVRWRSRCREALDHSSTCCRAAAVNVVFPAVYMQLQLQCIYAYSTG